MTKPNFSSKSSSGFEDVHKGHMNSFYDHLNIIDDVGIGCVQFLNEGLLAKDSSKARSSKQMITNEKLTHDCKLAFTSRIR